MVFLKKWEDGLLLLTDTICGVARKQHSFVDLDGNRYVGIGTDKFLLVYFEGTLYDITPWRSNNAGAQTTFYFFYFSNG